MRSRVTTARRGRRQALRRAVYAFAGALAVYGVVLVAGSWPNRIRPLGIVIHHSALGPEADRRADAAEIDRVHRRRGFGTFYGGRVYHIGYHYVVLPDGTVQPGRPERCRGAHTRGHNDRIGICVVGNFDPASNPRRGGNAPAPTGRQIRAVTRLCRRLLRRYDLPAEAVHRHRDFNPRTACPGDGFPLGELRRALRGPERSGRVGRKTSSGNFGPRVLSY